MLQVAEAQLGCHRGVQEERFSCASGGGLGMWLKHWTDVEVAFLKYMGRGWDVPFCPLVSAVR